MIYLLYQSPWPVGGSTSYTVHLAKVLGDACRVVRLSKRTEVSKREIKGSGVQYQNVSLADLLRVETPILLTASNPSMDEYVWERLAQQPNVWATFHDPHEFKLYPHWKHFSRNRVICIRETGLQHMPHGTFIPHPYMRFTACGPITRKGAISIARTSSVKRSQIIFEANRLLPAHLRVRLLGEPNRMWFNFYVKQHYPEVVAGKGYPRTWGAGVALCAGAHWMVDLTTFPGDGGGTQYSFLEAIDGGAVPIMSADWCSYPGSARKFGPAVRDAVELVHVLRRVSPGKWQEANWRYLRRVHNPKAIRQQYLSTLEE